MNDDEANHRPYEPYISEYEAALGLASGVYLQGQVRINNDGTLCFVKVDDEAASKRKDNELLIRLKNEYLGKEKPAHLLHSGPALDRIRRVHGRLTSNPVFTEEDFTVNPAPHDVEPGVREFPIASDDHDVFIPTGRYRNRAFDGDVVVVQELTKPKSKAKPNDINQTDAPKQADEKILTEQMILSGQYIPETSDDDSGDEDETEGPTLPANAEPASTTKKRLKGSVVHVLKRAEKRLYTGTLHMLQPRREGDDAKENTERSATQKPKPERLPKKVATVSEVNAPKNIWFKPNDKRVPCMLVPIGHAPRGFLQSRGVGYEGTLYVCTIVYWGKRTFSPIGQIIEKLGKVNELHVGTTAILRAFSVPSHSFSQSVIDCLPPAEFKIPDTERERRRSFVDDVLFSIDPKGARDLDDTVSLSKLPNGNYEIGVHIADVSHFVLPDTELDFEAGKRCTSIYLVDTVVPMLPRRLSESLCSLNPGVERLAFSVVWEMTPDATMKSVWFGKSIILSNCKLAYEDAQQVIEGGSLNAGIEVHGKSTRHRVQEAIHVFYDLSKQMRARRFSEGALSLNSIRLKFALDKHNEPTSCEVAELQDANRLIEEFMLLANMSVARLISSTFPESALLRRHPPPSSTLIKQFAEKAARLGYPINVDSAGSLEASLSGLPDDVRMVLMLHCIRPMRRAEYFSTGCMDPEHYAHYGLSVPVYTHFTSPIRRYADVIVHRLLARALEQIDWKVPDSAECKQIADECNRKRELARAAQEASQHFYLCRYISRQITASETQAPLECEAVVVWLEKDWIDVVLPEYGIERRFFLAKMAVEDYSYDKDENQISIGWKAEQTDYWEPVQAEAHSLIVDEEKDTIEEPEGEHDVDMDEATGEAVAAEMESRQALNARRRRLLDETVELETKKLATVRAVFHSTCQALSRDQILENSFRIRFPPAFRPKSMAAAAQSCQKISVFSKLQVLLTADLEKYPPVVNLQLQNPFAKRAGN